MTESHEANLDFQKTSDQVNPNVILLQNVDDANVDLEDEGYERKGDLEEQVNVSDEKRSESMGKATTPPLMTLFPPSKEELSNTGKATLLCLAQGFYPGSLNVLWAAGGITKTGHEIQTSEAEQQSDGSYHLSSFLQLSAEEWQSGQEFSCQLSHQALSSPMKKSISSTNCAH
ncbi:LAC protein, partial [Polypterus senegalus]